MPPKRKPQPASASRSKRGAAAAESAAAAAAVAAAAAADGGEAKDMDVAESEGVEEGLTLLIDNYDSFTYNLYQYLCELGATVRVVRNDALSLAQLQELNPVRVVISPGPGKPSEAGVSLDVIKAFAGKIPVLGVCLGHQAIAQAFGGKVVKAAEIMHGKVSSVEHDGKCVFAGLPQGVHMTRYHSLVAERASLPAALVVSAWCPSSGAPGERVVMGLRHKTLTVEGVQFHPESICSEHGKTLLRNFLRVRGGTWR